MFESVTRSEFFRKRLGLVFEVLRLSPETAGLLMTGGVKPPDVPEGVALVRKPFSTAALILTVQSRLTRSAELLAESRELRERTKQLRSELDQAVQNSIENLRQSSDKRR
jgi:hypothetical protein